MPATEVALIGADWVLTFALLKGTVVALTFILAAHLVARSNPPLRAMLWTGCFAALVFAPAATGVVPRWTAPLVGFPERLWRTASEGSTTTLSPGSIPLAVWCFAIWFVVALLRLVRVGLDIRAARRISRVAVPITDPRTPGMLKRARQLLRVSRPVRLASSDSVSGPVSLGWLRPVILLPAGFHEWPADRLQAVLLHEVAHVRRGDWPVVISCEIVRAVYWINPLAAWMVRQLRYAQDRACDALAIRRGGIRADEYARHLVEVARTLRPRESVAAVLPLVDRRGLEARVRDAMRPTRRLSALSLLTTGMLTLLFSVGVAGADLWRCDTTEREVAASASSSPA